MPFQKSMVNRKIIYFLTFLLSCFLTFSSPAFAAEPSMAGFEEAVVNVADTVGKAVVSISAERTQKAGGIRRYYFGQAPQDGPFEDEFFRRFFEDFFGEIPEREYKQVGLGSGVIIDREGYILTNEHVVGDADKITVTLPDGREFKAQLKGTDKRSDLAVIKIEGRDFPAAGLGDSDGVKIGQWVVAIGNPFGYAIHNPEPTVTAGVISALHRSLGKISADRDYNDLIQTDAAINPGNSGGPLVNLKGEVIGINVAIFSTSGGYQGIGFAVPANSAKRIVSRLIEGKKIVYGWLGIMIQNLDENLVNYFGLTEKKGVLVSKVIKDSPAEKAGIKEGDIILKLDGQETNNVNSLLKIVGETPVGKSVHAGLLRDKQKISLEVKIEARPEDIAEEAIPKESPRQTESYWRGIEVKEITPELSRKFNLSEQQGVVITDIKPNSPADEAGLISGDIILGINRIYIDSLNTYKRLIKGISGDCLVRTARGFFVLKSDVGKK